MKDTQFCELDEHFIEYINYTSPHNMPVQHYHDSYEIYFLLSGTRNHFICDEYFQMHPGDVMLVKPFELHYSTSLPEYRYERFVLNIKKHVLLPIFTKQEIDELFKIFDYRILHLNEKNNVSFSIFSKKPKKSGTRTGFCRTSYAKPQLPKSYYFYATFPMKRKFPHLHKQTTS